MQGHTPSVRIVLLTALLATAVAGCEMEAEIDEVHLRNGETTFLRPEIGQVWSGVWLCTGTLVAPNVVLTAAHCVDFKTGPTNDMTFTMVLGENRIRQVEIVESVSMSLPTNITNAAANAHSDLALLRLAESVPAEIATPARIATQKVVSGDTVTLFGYGKSGSGPFCALGGPLDLLKRSHTIQWAKLRSETCGGDSGGPIVLGEANQNGPILATISGSLLFGMADMSGDPVRHRASLSAWIEGWRQ